jgi:hypothetical protein
LRTPFDTCALKSDFPTARTAYSTSTPGRKKYKLQSKMPSVTAANQENKLSLCKKLPLINSTAPSGMTLLMQSTQALEKC